MWPLILKQNSSTFFKVQFIQLTRIVNNVHFKAEHKKTKHYNNITIHLQYKFQQNNNLEKLPRFRNFTTSRPLREGRKIFMNHRKLQKFKGVDLAGLMTNSLVLEGVVFLCWRVSTIFTLSSRRAILADKNKDLTHLESSWRHFSGPQNQFSPKITSKLKQNNLLRDQYLHCIAISCMWVWQVSLHGSNKICKILFNARQSEHIVGSSFENP